MSISSVTESSCGFIHHRPKLIQNYPRSAEFVYDTIVFGSFLLLVSWHSVRFHKRRLHLAESAQLFLVSPLVVGNRAEARLTMDAVCRGEDSTRFMPQCSEKDQ